MTLALLASAGAHAAGHGNRGDNGDNGALAPVTAGATSSIEAVTRYARDAKGRVTRIDYPDGGFRTIDYNAIDKPTRECDALARCVDREYDRRGLESEIRYPDGTRIAREFDPNGNIVAETNRRGHTTKFVFDPANRLIEVVHPDDTPTTDSDNPRTRSVYDAAGRLVGGIDPAGRRTTFEYDAANRRTAVIDPLGHATRTEYDPAGRISATVDAKGRRTEYRLDDAGRLSETILPDGSSIKVEYDVMGRKTAEVRHSSKRTEYRYDALGRLTEVPTAVGTNDAANTRYTYDEDGNRLTQTDAEGRTTRWAHDDGGRVTRRTLPSGEHETSQYNLAGERIAHTDFNGNTTRYGHTAMGELASVNFPTTPDVAISYVADQRVEVRDGNGTTRFEYHPRGSLAAVEFPNGEAVAYRYDARGNRTELTTANQHLTFAYDELNRLTSVTAAQGTTRYEYDAVGNRIATRWPNGVRTAYGYDEQNRLTSLTHHASSGTLLFGASYALDADGLRTRIEERDAAGVVRTITYTYDDANRLVAETIIARDIGQSRTSGWTYDKIGNRTTQALAIGAAFVTTTYTYDPNDRLLSETVGGETTTYAYDRNGNTKTKTGPLGLVAYTYDDANRLVEMRDASGRYTYGYDVDGLRISQTHAPGNGPSTSTFYLLDKGREYAQVIEEHVQEGSGPRRLAATYTFGDDLIAQIRGGVTHYVHADGMSSTRLLTDTSGALTDTFAFDAFGNELARSGSTIVGHLYRGEQFDPNLGFYNLRARFYDPRTGRFATMDTFAGLSLDPPSLHKYLYSHADPVNHLDPSGHITLGELATAQNVNRAIFAATTAYNVFNIGQSLIDGTFDPAEAAKEVAISYLVAFSGARLLKVISGPFTRAAAKVCGGGAGRAAANECVELVSKVPGRVRSRINIPVGDLKRGWRHVLHEHFNPAKKGKSQFSIDPDNLDLILREKKVVGSPISRVLGSNDGDRFVREVDVGQIIGNDARSGNAPTSLLTIMTDKFGNLITAYPGR